MKATLMSQVRWEQTEEELHRIKQQVTAWLAHRRQRDPQGYHQTQLATIESVLLGALKRLTEKLNEVQAALPQLEVEAVYDQCRDFDQSILWVNRLWSFFRDKFDQRDEPQYAGPLLKAADEMIWSCFWQVFETKQLTPQHPAPLCYIEPEYSPAAIVSDQPMPHGLRLEADIDFLDEFLATLPLPVLRLPPWCVQSPWWLVFIAHEVGHHIQHELDLVEPFQQGLQQAAQKAGATPAASKTWGDWGEEIFADMFSLLMAGQWALWAMAEVELSAPAAMTAPKPRYPAAVVRLALMREIAMHLKLDTTAALRGLDLDAIAQGNATTAQDFALAKTLAAAAFAGLEDCCGKPSDFCGFDQATFQAGGTIENWANLLRSSPPPPGEKNLASARNIVSGAVAAWAEVSAFSDRRVRTAEKKQLVENTLQVLQESGPEGTRADAQPDGKRPEKGREFADLLLARSRQQKTDGSGL
jgi:hypothetical protein